MKKLRIMIETITIEKTKMYQYNFRNTFGIVCRKFWEHIREKVIEHDILQLFEYLSRALFKITFGKMSSN